MRFLWNLLGLACLALSFYFIQQNIFWTDYVVAEWWGPIAANGAILAMAIGIVMLCMLAKPTRWLGWLVLIAGIILMFRSERVVFRLTNWAYIASAAVSFVAGYCCLRLGRFSL